MYLFASRLLYTCGRGTSENWIKVAYYYSSAPADDITAVSMFYRQWYYVTKSTVSQTTRGKGEEVNNIDVIRIDQKTVICHVTAITSAAEKDFHPGSSVVCTKSPNNLLLRQCGVFDQRFSSLLSLIRVDFVKSNCSRRIAVIISILLMMAGCRSFFFFLEQNY